MIGKNYRYNWFDMTDRVAIQSGFALQDVDITTVQRQEIVDNANDHWSSSSRTLESGRLFSFVWKVSRLTKEERWATRKMITDALNVEIYMNTTYLHDLFFQTDEGDERQVKCLVKEKPKGSNGLHNPEINFTFDLYAPWNAVYWINEGGASWESSFFGWTSFGNKFGDAWWDFAWAASCENEGNYKAWCRIEIVGALTNPLIKNITNGQQYKINGQTTNLVLDSKDWRLVTDEGINISNKREYWSAILLSPGVNEIAVFADWGSATFTVNWFSARNTI